MPTLLHQLDQAFRAAVQDALNLQADPQIGISQNDKFGDYQANAAMGLAKLLAESTGQKSNPRAIAEQIKTRLQLGDMASEVSIAGPGFINVRISPAWLGKHLDAIRPSDRLGIDQADKPQTIVIDYSSPNVAKQMHVGHLRSTNIGDCLARILEFQGNHVLRQNHIGDWGTAFGMLLAYLKESGGDAASSLSDLEEFYRASKKRFDEEPAFADRSREMVVRLQAGGEEERRLWKQIIAESRKHFQSIYDRLNVSLKVENERGESFYNDRLQDVVKELKSTGTAQESQGATVVWVKGFEAPLIIQKSGGGFNYGTTDLAALRYRIRELHAHRIIYVTDSRQVQHFNQFFDAAKQAGWTKDVQLDHVTFGTITGPDGKPFKTKSGDNIKLKELLDEAKECALAVVTSKNPDLPAGQRQAIAHAVGIGAIKYYDLARDWIGNYAFDWEKMLALDGNTAPYLQYAHARICSIFRKSEDAQPGPIHLDSPFELSLAKQIIRLGEVIEQVGRELKPHHLCGYLYELATRFNGFFENCPVLKSEPAIKSSRLALCQLTAKTLELGLDLLGIEHPDQM